MSVKQDLGLGSWVLVSFRHDLVSLKNLCGSREHVGKGERVICLEETRLGCSSELGVAVG